MADELKPYELVNIYKESRHSRISSMLFSLLGLKLAIAGFAFTFSDLPYRWHLSLGCWMGGGVLALQARAATRQADKYQRRKDARELVAKAFERPEITLASRNTYGNRLNQFLSWMETQSWYPSDRMLRIQDQCRSSRKFTGRRRVQDLRLTSREGAYLEYSLKPEETPAALQEVLDDLDRFMVAPRYAGRVRRRISESTRDSYFKDIRLLLGFCVRYQPNPISLTELALTHLMPLVTRQDLARLTELDRDDLWRSQELALETWIANYFVLFKRKIAPSVHALIG
jgi:hypothetical protein